MQPQPDARLNTETPGSAIDRLSILALRLYHMEEQACRGDATDGHVAKAKARLEILRQQHRDLPSLRRTVGRSLRRPQAAEGLPPVQDVQRPDDEPVSLCGETSGGVSERRKAELSYLSAVKNLREIERELRIRDRLRMTGGLCDKALSAFPLPLFPLPPSFLGQLDFLQFVLELAGNDHPRRLVDEANSSSGRLVLKWVGQADLILALGGRFERVVNDRFLVGPFQISLVAEDPLAV